MDNTPPKRQHHAPAGARRASASQKPDRRQAAALLRRGKRFSRLSALLGIASIICVMVHFFVSPLNSKILLAGGYTGMLFGLVPMALGAVGVVMAVNSRKTLPRGQDGFAIVGMITSVIGMVFGSIQLFTCTLCVHFNWFGINLGPIA